CLAPNKCELPQFPDPSQPQETNDAARFVKFQRAFDPNVYPGRPSILTFYGECSGAGPNYWASIEGYKLPFSNPLAFSASGSCFTVRIQSASQSLRLGTANPQSFHIHLHLQTMISQGLTFAFAPLMDSVSGYNYMKGSAFGTLTRGNFYVG